MALAVEGTGDWHAEELRSLPPALFLRTGTMSSGCGERMPSQKVPWLTTPSLLLCPEVWAQSSKVGDNSSLEIDHKATRQDVDALFPDFPKAGSQMSSPQRDLARIKIRTPSQLHPHIISRFIFFALFSQ